MKVKLQLIFLVISLPFLSFSSQRAMGVCPISLSYYTAKCEQECAGIKEVDFNTYGSCLGSKLGFGKCEDCFLSATPSGCNAEGKQSPQVRSMNFSFREIVNIIL